MDNGSGFGEGSWIFGLIVLLGLFGGFGGGFGNNNAAMAGFATINDVNSAINNQSVQQSLNAGVLSSANNNYETAQLINNQTNAMMNQQNSNLINAIQGFNQVTNGMATGFANVSSQIADLGYKLDNCCCSIKTMMLENRLQDAQAALVTSQTINAINGQSQYLLSQLGTYTPV